MERTFSHDFDPPAANPRPGGRVGLTIQHIENAGLLEVLQTPGVSFGSWAIFDALLQPTGDGTPFMFRAPLGEAREVKVALSGLLGRFVARAYLQTYFGLTIFAHVRLPRMMLDGRRKIEVFRRQRGDLPDWIACNSELTDLTIAEAKGSHDPFRTSQVLSRAWKQAQRIDIQVGGQAVPVKRIAIATRWGMSSGGPREARISARDPFDERRPVSHDKKDALFTGVVRHHIANMIDRLGHSEIADALRRLASAESDSLETEQEEKRRAANLVDTVDEVPWEVVRSAGDFVGGVVTRCGSFAGEAVSQTDAEVLARLDMRPVFVGLERRVLKAAIEGNAATIRGALEEGRTVEGAVGSSAGCRIIPLVDETHTGV